MKILFDHSLPFLLAHGGFQTQIEQTKAALEKLGVEVEWLRWWDDQQRGDVLHYFGAPSNAYLSQARAVKLPVILNTLFTETCNRSDAQLARQGWMTQAILAMRFGQGIKQQLAWRTYHNCSQNVVSLEAECRVLQTVYRVSRERISIVPYGLSDGYLKAGPGRRHEAHLISTGTITPRKNCVELAQMARAAEVPVLFVGKPYDPSDPYWLQFKKLIDDRWVHYHAHVHTEVEMIALLHGARGFVLMSKHENWCLSAHEAVACGLSILVPDQKWSRERFGDQARYFTSLAVTPGNIEILRQFYADAPGLPSPKITLFSWADVARQLRSIYEGVLRTS